MALSYTRYTPYKNVSVIHMFGTPDAGETCRMIRPSTVSPKRVNLMNVGPFNIWTETAPTPDGPWQNADYCSKNNHTDLSLKQAFTRPKATGVEIDVWVTEFRR